MRWNWTLPDWPRFVFDAARLHASEQAFVRGAGVVVGALHHVDGAAQQGLAVALLSRETVDSSAIEGELLDRASVQSSLAQRLGMAADHRRAGPAEAGAAELSDAALFAWHGMLMNGRRDLAVVAGYRTHADAMQIVSGALHAPRVHFEAPPSPRVPDEMARFVAWFNDSAPGGATPLPALTRAGLAHLWFETIHPFEDGNGRIGRAIAEKALAQTLGAPTLTALATTIHRHRKGYYDALHRASVTLHVDAWLDWFAGIALLAQADTIAQIRFVIDKTRLLDRLRGRINDRQEKVLLRMLAEGPDGFRGGLSAGNYRTITGAAPATTTRDLAELVVLGAVRRIGERRYARYHLVLNAGDPFSLSQE